MSRAFWAVLALLCAPAAPSSAELTVNPPYADVRGGQPLVLTLATGTVNQLEQPHCLIGTPAALTRACAVPLPCRRTGPALPPAHRTHLRHRAACTGGHHCATSSRADVPRTVAPEAAAWEGDHLRCPHLWCPWEGMRSCGAHICRLSGVVRGVYTTCHLPPRP